MKRDPVVLVVEDDPYVSKLIALLLEESNYRVQTVDTAAAALELVNAGDLDLVILDWMLPDTHGDQLCRMIKASSPNAFLPVLMLTARGEPADRVAGLDAGADDYLTKPFYANELLARVRALLRIRVSELDRINALDQLAQQHDTLKAAYDQLRSTQAQLVHASKLAALGELVAGVAHELNNPLAIILGNAELLPELEDEEDRRAVEQIINGAHRARRVVQSLVTFARAGKIDEDWYDPRLLVERVLDLRRTSLRAAGIILDVSYAPDLPMLWVDGPQIQQVLLNLLLNAEQALAGRPEQRISICVFTSVEPVDHPPVLPESACTDEGQADARIVVIDVADNGPGLSDQVADRVFQPFVTTKPVGQGTGLGLAISYGIVVQHGGSLQFSSEVGRGATFRVVLPADRPATQEVHDEPMVLAEPVPKSVLLIDDEPDILDLAQRFLVRNKYSVATTQSARAALRMLQERSFDVILCDVRMPDMDGIAFYHELQATDLEHRPHMIVMTGDTSNAKTEEFLRMSKLPLLRKPFTSHELLEVVAFVELLERREV